MNHLKKLYCRAFQSCFHMAIPLMPYRNPSIRNSLHDIPGILQKQGVGRVLVVTDQGLVRAGLLELLTLELEKSGVPYVVYSDTVPNPTIENVESALALYLSSHCEGIIALGGGSAMDCAKACGARVVYPHKSVAAMKGILKVHRRLPLLIAIPTTAGTGSETTLAAVVTDSKLHSKYSIMSFPLIPRYAVLDYRLTTSLPPAITSTTGMDALTHAIEAYIGRSTTAETRSMAIEATRLISQYLYRAYIDGQDAEARQQMLRAAYCAGVAFTKSYVGYVHAVAHSLSGAYGTPHGLANAVLLPIVLREYGSAAEKKLSNLARAAGIIQGENDHEVAVGFIDWIQQMNDKMGIPRQLSGIQKSDIDGLAAHADKEGNPLYPVPVLWDKEQLKKIYHLASCEAIPADGVFTHKIA